MHGDGHGDNIGLASHAHASHSFGLDGLDKDELLGTDELEGKKFLLEEKSLFEQETFLEQEESGLRFLGDEGQDHGQHKY